MKKLLPLIILVVGVAVFVLGFFIFKSKNNEKDVDQEEETTVEIPVDKSPFISLIPTKDGHYLKLTIDKLYPGSKSLDYELLYNLEDGRAQGVPGTVKLEGLAKVERDILLGSESSGKFRYDEGVKSGTVTVRFRDEKGKLMGKSVAEFTFSTNTKSLKSPDGKFVYNLDKADENYYIVMNTVGYLVEPPSQFSFGPYGIFSSATNKIKGQIDAQVEKLFNLSNNTWTELSSKSSENVGIFIGY